MARGRMISKSLSTSEKRAALHDEAGKLAEFCQALYPLLIAHADDWGCLQGDAFTVKHLVDPSSPRPVSHFAQALVHLHNVGLITWYDADDRKVVYIRAFAVHQQLRGHDSDGRKRNFAEPPKNPNKIEHSAQIRPESPKHALREEKRTELKRTEPIRSPQSAGTVEADPDLDTDSVTNRDIGGFVKRFCELYSKHRYGARYHVKRARDVPLVRSLLHVYPRDRLEKLTVILLTTDDDWVRETDRGICVLSTKATWLDNLLAEHEARHGAIGVAS